VTDRALWLLICLVVTVLVTTCAHLGRRGYFKPDDVRKWEAVECTKFQVMWVHEHLLKGTASPGMCLYYYRCKGPNEYKQMLKEIRKRGR
jgi:hypothetical protein